LVVPRGPEAKLNHRPAGEDIEGEEVAAIQIGAVHGERIDILSGVKLPQETLAATSVGVATDAHNIVIPTCPFALHANELRQ
jgi:hypothetical protein